MVVFDALPGVREVLLDPLLPDNFPEKNTSVLHDLPRIHDVICLQEIHGKNEFLQAIQVLVLQFRLYGTFVPNNVSAGGSAICIHESLLPDRANVTHVITCVWRSHRVTSTSVNQRKEGSTSGTKPSRMVMRGRLPFSGPSSLLKLRSPTFQGKILQPMVPHARSRIDRAFIYFLVATFLPE